MNRSELKQRDISLYRDVVSLRIFVWAFAFAWVVLMWQYFAPAGFSVADAVAHLSTGAQQLPEVASSVKSLFDGSAVSEPMSQVSRSLSSLR